MRALPELLTKFRGDALKERDLVTLPRFLDPQVVALGTHANAFGRALSLLCDTCERRAARARAAPHGAPRRATTRTRVSPARARA